ncbi:cytochrome ubiquinol oxidase subunit I [Wolbachia endosymbiont of Atemnus politus]|uniref:cytochrome ubiquinol oxidase subunit I n=1 Tax=Wolbachia endosymbiont of Atemnus politus TaxID=2682840 RepID=UPI00397E3026
MPAAWGERGEREILKEWLLSRNKDCVNSVLSKMSALLLARIQFAFTISFHIIFTAFTIGLASFLAF